MPQRSLHTPVGDITIFEDDGAIVALEWGWVPDQDETPLLIKTAELLNAYFDGDSVNFNIPMHAEGTSFQQAVWREMLKIPQGETRTYNDLAKALNSHARAVGSACGQNPIPIIIPCHRVLASSGKLGGFTADGGVETKEALLRLEGAWGMNEPELPL
jgi:methylated-DNA-[protein]-cysteine S-methyltransferase